jgi:cytochrome c peroxidase
MRSRSPSILSGVHASGTHTHSAAAIATSRLARLGSFSLLALAACAGADLSDASPERRSEDLSGGYSRRGARLFDEPFAGTNGRSCASCHARDDHTTLTPAHVQDLLASAPDDVLFNGIDADDPAAPDPSFEHLQKGLVRVVLRLADNVDVIDADGRVITAADRSIFVWRGVPSVENTALTAPYQYDGRAATLEEQAQGAIVAHSQGGSVSDDDLKRIADFEQAVFSSARARFVFEQIEHGTPLEYIPDPEAHLRLSAGEASGRQVYESACAPCHGGATTREIVDPAIHDFAFFELGADGNVQFDTSGEAPVPVFASHANDGFLPGYSVLSYLGQVGAFPAFNASVQLPRYRLRFYTDATRRQPVTELPPRPVTFSGEPTDPRPAVDANGAPIVGPNFVPQAFSTDPGRAAITGNPLDFEATDMPQLRGAAKTAPYFHDNSAATLQDVVDIYSRFVLGALPTLGLPPVNPPETPNSPPEALSPAQKIDLLAFLQRL